jgi:hypothetical protein
VDSFKRGASSQSQIAGSYASTVVTLVVPPRVEQTTKDEV